MSTAEGDPKPRSEGGLGTPPIPAARASRPRPSDLARHWPHDPAVIFLNHGSFGSVPVPVMERQREYQDRLQREPVRFMVDELEPLLDDARVQSAAFVGCPADDFAFVLNATSGVDTVIRSLRFNPGDEILTNPHEYNACQNVLRWAEQQWGLVLVSAPVPFPIRSADQAVDAVLARSTPRTRLALISHITSPTALVLPVERLVAGLSARGIDTLIDGAHAPGMLPLDVAALNPTYYTGNFHKWACSPPGSAFLYVRRDRQPLIRPLVISHGANSKRTDRSRFRLEFDWAGTADPSAWLCVPHAIRFMAGLFADGWAGVRRHNNALARAARDLLCRELGAEPPAPDDMLGSMACVRLPDRTAPEAAQPTRYHDPLQDRLIGNHGIQVPIVPFPGPPTRYVRVSAQAYNSIEQYRYLARALKAETAAG